jgi:hypothetical protein
MLDMSKFWPNLTEATADLGGTSFQGHIEPGDGCKRWPGAIRTATVQMPSGSEVGLHYVDCYGWCKSNPNP